MGQFSWLDCVDDSQIIDNAIENVYVLVPKEFGGGHIKETCYDGYGIFGGHDIYDLIVDWNKEYIPTMVKLAEGGDWKCGMFVNIDELLALANGGELTLEKRMVGIMMACYDEDNERLPYPIKITHDPNAIYENCSPSPADPNQGWPPEDFEEDDEYEDDDEDEVNNSSYCACPHCTDGTCDISPDDSSPCSGTSDEMEECAYVDAHTVTFEKMDRNTQQSCKKEVDYSKYTEQYEDDEEVDWERYDNELLWNILKEHRGHRIEIATYGDWDNPASITLEDMDTNEIILDAELYTICAREDA